MNHLSIGIPTYKRPKMLLKTIESILQNNIDKSLIDNVDIIIIDNDVNKSAEDVVNNIKKSKNKFSIHYYSFIEKGLSKVRNEIFKRALEYNPDYIIFIDDDEYAAQDWLNQLLLKIVSNEADMVLGRVIPVFESKVSPSLVYWFKYHDFVDNIKLKFVDTNNLIIRSEFIKKNNISFDLRFNTTGSEDTFFGIQALKNGAKILWAKNAVVYETIPDRKANIKWLIRRYYRAASTFTYILKLENKYIKLFKKLMISIGYLISGIIALIMTPLPIKIKYWGIIKISESIGGFAGLINIRYQEYKN